MNARRRRWHFPIVFSQISSSSSCFSFSFFLRDLCHHLRFSFHFRDCTWITRDEMCAVRLQWRKTPSRNLIYPFIYFYGQVEREKKKRPPCVTQSPFSVCVFCPRISKKENKKKLRRAILDTRTVGGADTLKTQKKKEEEEEKWKMENKTAQWKSCVCTRPWGQRNFPSATQQQQQRPSRTPNKIVTRKTAISTVI